MIISHNNTAGAEGKTAAACRQAAHAVMLRRYGIKSDNYIERDRPRDDFCRRSGSEYIWIGYTATRELPAEDTAVKAIMMAGLAAECLLRGADPLTFFTLYHDDFRQLRFQPELNRLASPTERMEIDHPIFCVMLETVARDEFWRVISDYVHAITDDYDEIQRTYAAELREFQYD
jgi:hypothetical protein